MCCVGTGVNNVGIVFCFQMKQFLLQLHPWKLIAFTLQARKVEKTKVKGGNRKANRKEKESQRQSPKVMESQTTKESRKETERANQVGSPMIPLDTRAKAIAQVECAIDVASQGTMHVTVGRPMLELCSQRVNNYRILRLHNHCRHLQAQLQWEPQSSTQFRVARIHEVEFQGSSDAQRHDEVIFDLRSPASNASRHEGSVRVVKYYIGDELSGFENV